VDAYVDLASGSIVGNMTPKTRYLIRGDDLRTADAAKPAAPKAEGEEGKEDKKEPVKDAPPQINAERNEQVNKSNFLMRNEARDRGLLLISAENFATVIGYRKARNANIAAVAGFRPTLPYAGATDVGAAKAPMEEEKKAPAAEVPEKKEVMEKKEKKVDEEKKAPDEEKKKVDEEKKDAEKKAPDDEKKALDKDKKADDEKKAADKKKDDARNGDAIKRHFAMEDFHGAAHEFSSELWVSEEDFPVAAYVLSAKVCVYPRLLRARLS
jgi:hypothetical protein